jgi:hypothetical protein
LIPFQARVAADHAKRASALQPGHAGLLVQKKVARSGLSPEPPQVCFVQGRDKLNF